MRLLAVAALAAMLAVCSTSIAFSADLFNISSPAFKDGDLVQTKSYLGNRVAGDGSPCGGSDVSPPVAWANPPAGTLSFAFTIIDVDGGMGQTSIHWVTYDIPPTQMTMGENAWRQPTFPFAQGKLASGFTGYRGFCPPKTDAAHHYVLTVYALDLPPTLAADMTRGDLLAAINKHALGVASMVARIAR
jgi:Raf kinase inhibitor-like YbhB/YbcL family protein